MIHIRVVCFSKCLLQFFQLIAGEDCPGIEIMNHCTTHAIVYTISRCLYWPCVSKKSFPLFCYHCQGKPSISFSIFSLCMNGRCQSLSFSPPPLGLCFGFLSIHWLRSPMVIGACLRRLLQPMLVNELTNSNNSANAILHKPFKRNLATAVFQWSITTSGGLFSQTPQPPQGDLLALHFLK